MSRMIKPKASAERRGCFLSAYFSFLEKKKSKQKKKQFKHARSIACYKKEKLKKPVKKALPAARDGFFL
ncbi:hypothetical protein U6B65_10870 [Oscillospiraceae bacterium MB08-C2-2]|nr:hypothetical protein U6B65_10870 [Oscillospiraceae bacterium MB08-C2-2]